tara:strand:+ start:191 stop:436 length:246 start_codon:yes stop_codon:yes gene_type:complete
MTKRLILPEGSKGTRIIQGILTFLFPMYFLFNGYYVALIISLTILGLIGLLIYFKLEGVVDSIIGVFILGLFILAIIGANT